MKTTTSTGIPHALSVAPNSQSSFRNKYATDLEMNPIVQSPHYSKQYDAREVEAFGRFARNFQKIVKNHPEQYPNASLIPAFAPHLSFLPGLSFMAVWGEAIEFPVPNEQTARTAFTAFERRRAQIGKKILHHTTLNGHGFVGNIHATVSGEDVVDVSARVNSVQGSDSLETYTCREQSLGRVGLLAYEVIERFDAGEAAPLRFKAGIMHNPINGYTANEYDSISQHDQITVIARRATALSI